MLMDLSKFFDNSIKESIGCTEPVAIALAVAVAFNAIKGRLPHQYSTTVLSLNSQQISEEIEKIIVKTDRGIFKNALQVGIPNGFGLRGNCDAASLGVFCDPGLSLRLFSSLDEAKASYAKDLIRGGMIQVFPQYDWSRLRIEAVVKTKSGTGISHITSEHSNITYIAVDGQVKLAKDDEKDAISELNCFRGISDFVDTIEEDYRIYGNNGGAIKAVEKAIVTNHRASIVAEHEFSNSRRDSLALALRSLTREGYFSEDCLVLAKEKVSMTVEARMTGFNIKVATCAGSGNMGIVSTLPILVLGLYEFNKKYPNYDIEWETTIDTIRTNAPEYWMRIVRAVGIVHLIANYVSIYSGKLSASCGCGTKAGIGLAAGLAYFLTPPNINDREIIISGAINGVARSIFGMICDGGKEGCALKTAAATGVAIESALLSCRRLDLSNSDGIANRNAMITLRNIGAISDEMADIDKMIIELAQTGLIPNDVVGSKG